MAIDDDIVAESNLGRLIGSIPNDIDVTMKVDVMQRMIEAIDPEITVTTVRHRFPHPDAVEALKDADVIIGCLDSWLAREQINVFARRHLVPLIDVGIQIDTDECGHLKSANGQVIAVTPDSSCTRCFFVTDARLARERRERPPGYDLNPNAGDPQVVSMNGTLASEAVNAALDIVTGYSGGVRVPGWWQYDGRKGSLDRHDLPFRRRGCPGCAEAGLADP